MLEVLLVGVAGLVVGWFVLPRPAWAEEIWKKLGF